MTDEPTQPPPPESATAAEPQPQAGAAPAERDLPRPASDDAPPELESAELGSSRPPGEASGSAVDAEGLRRAFYEGGEATAVLDDPTPLGHDNALQKLGRPPFEKSSRSKFRLLGFLATVYEHASQDVAKRGDGHAGPEDGTSTSAEPGPDDASGGSDEATER